MSDIVIKAENVGKSYLIGHKSNERYVALRDVIANKTKGLWSKIRNPRFHTHKNIEEFWALKDVSFEVKQGDRVGIIGRNGAGKSTLLKILSRITEPTAGRVSIKGRVASLLEVGTGFHPELTGRENIYLNGAILGMTRKEIKTKFDEIVDFAEVEKFLDTPVKRFSSGMYVRLAFAVAAHLEPEILVVDEVLAVGDSEFQKKCLGKMRDVATKGRTVLFVSHNMAAINQLCNIGILLDKGQVINIDEVNKVVGVYLSINSEKQESVDLTTYPYRRGTKEAMFAWVQTCNLNGSSCRKFSIGENIILNFRVNVCEQYRDKKIKLAIELRSSDGIRLCNMVDVDSHFEINNAKETEEISVCLYDVRFYPDTYYVSFWVGSVTSTETFDRVEDCLSFEIIGGGNLTARFLPRSAGLLFITPEWKRNA
ncbi:MAG: ABC transporter ATP-binding protein [Candidatus Ratteibacteria bacterium]|jgi:lipopolysaccharide transport system ATP-binding protein